MTVARSAAIANMIQRSAPMMVTPAGGGSSPSVKGSWSGCSGVISVSEPAGRSSLAMVGSVQHCRIEWSERLGWDVGSDGRVQIGQRVIERRTRHDDVMFDVDGGAA